jgi:hypothetical protein
MDNPFVERNKYKRQTNQIGIVYPEFGKQTRITISLSGEAAAGIANITTKLLGVGHKPHHLIEAIGLYALSVSIPPTVQIPNSNETTEDCRQAGFEDAMEGHFQRFVTIYGNQVRNVFEEAYLQGYYEGNYIKNHE